MPPNQYSVTDAQFLMLVINNTQGGTIDYKAIAAAVGMPTVKAVTCKFWRLKKAHALAGDGKPATEASTNDGAAGGTKNEKEKKTTAKSAPSKKRKLNEAAHSEGEEDGEEQSPDLKPSKKVKAEDEEGDESFQAPTQPKVASSSSGVLSAVNNLSEHNHLLPRHLYHSQKLSKQFKVSTATDDQFLFAIIKQLDGSIDWQKVADECNIVTKGAAAKRFSRMTAKRDPGGNNGTEASPNGENASPEASAEKPRQRNTPKKPASKKRKVEESEGTPEAQDTVKEEEEE
ncbi:hypothetical protein KC327_g9396 [Hortaea werneckii]|nr:hypothetical protein KC358_g9699 [Hortaea werneckii]KAI6824960.1 hypothetical protein KC350_g8896 [Hortaea werneckii]KAI6922252.1 hypothetical protein KC348_g9846 [Hortaea werneckii]KAI6931613.1 hypothetical protein KC341_g9491 [Hortaea werneckii]KAI6966081.1 hypothetical protein KC321_g9752 [Hortaea werneckii]